MSLRQKTATALIVFVALWPAVTLWLQARWGVDPWKLMSFGMYATPGRRLEDVRVTTELPISTAALERYRDLRRTLGELAPLPPEAGRVKLETLRLDPRTDRVVIERRELP